MKAEPKANILIVDDDVKTLTAMEALLSGSGRNIVTAWSGNEALRQLLREDFALILMDVRLPEMDGFETAALIRQRERFRYTPIIFISAIDTLETDVFRGAASGAVDYLFKPVVPQVLQAKVSVFVDLFRMNEQLKQQAVRQSEERFRLVVESLQDYAVFMMDPNGRVSTWNRGSEQIGGWNQEEVIGQLFGKFYPPEDQKCGLPALALREAATHGRYEDEGWRIRKDGSQFWANLIVTALLDETGTLIGFSAIMRDLTERKRIEEELKRLNIELEARFADKAAELIKTNREREKLQEQLLQSQKMESIGTLAGGVAHDINNLLNVIAGYASIVGENAGAARVGEAVKVINEMVRRGATLVQQLLAMARKTETNFEPVQVNGVMEQVRVLLKETFPKEIETEWNLGRGLPTIMADPNQLHQVLLNLCLNARDAMPNGGKLGLASVSVSGAELRQSFQEAKEDQYLCLAVSDTGLGMENSTKSRIFEPFFTTKQPGEGTGLGLAVVYGIVNNHRGFIDVESTPNRGAAFRLYLPIPKNQPAAKDVQISAAVMSGTKLFGRGETILFAEDEIRQLRLMQDFLSARGFKVLAAKDGAEALEVFVQNKEQIALVILDLGLPKINGWDVFCKMKGINPRLKALFATGFIPTETEVQFSEVDLYSVILKPYQLDEVLKKVCSLLKQSQS